MTRRLAIRGLVAWALLAPACGADPPAVPPSREGKASRLSSATAALARWSPVISLPLIPVAAAVRPDGKVLVWGGGRSLRFRQRGRPDLHGDLRSGRPASSTERLATETGHDMFCPGTRQPRRTAASWSTAASQQREDQHLRPGARGLVGDGARAMNIPRGYQGNGPARRRLGVDAGRLVERAASATSTARCGTEATGWRRLAGRADRSVPVGSIPRGIFGIDSHLWLLRGGQRPRASMPAPASPCTGSTPTGNGRVLAASARAATTSSASTATP